MVPIFSDSEEKKHGIYYISCKNGFELKKNYIIILGCSSHCLTKNADSTFFTCIFM